MTGIVTWAGLDVHARSTHAAAIDAATGELVRARFGPGIEEPVAWLKGLPGPVRACYEAGPTGFGLYRAAERAGVDVQVIAPGKTPRGSSDRVKTDRKDAELLARLLLAGSLTTVVVPPVEIEAARELMRAHDACRRDLMTARHRVSKMLLRHGRVYPQPSTWTVAHRRWLASQQFPEAVSDLAFADLIAAVDGLSARKAQIAERLSRLAQDEMWWSTLARLRCFRGIDTLTAFALHLELGGDWQRFQRANALSAWLGLIPSLHQSGQSTHHGSITRDRLRVRAPIAGRVGLALRTSPTNRGDPQEPSARPARPHPADRQPCPAATAPRLSPHARPRQAAQRDRRGLRPRAGLLPLGSRNSRLTPPDSPPVERPGRRATSGRHARLPYGQHPTRCHARS